MYFAFCFQAQVRIVRWTIRIPRLLAKQVTFTKSGKASSNNPVECLKLEIWKRYFLDCRSNKSQLNDDICIIDNL